MDEDAGEAVDPRVKDQLEYLNSYTDEINSLELQLDDANATFRNTLSEYSQRLKLLAKKLGKCVQVARPYYEAEEAAQAAKLECEKAAIRYHRACSVHKEARETIAMAENKFNVKKEDYDFDAAWQEMLNRETIKLMNAEALKEESEKEHKRTTQIFAEAVEKVKVLEHRLKKDIIKSRSYFEQKKVFLKVLQMSNILYEDILYEEDDSGKRLIDLKNRVESLQKAVMDSKASYAACLHNLEMISHEIHERRKLNLPPREPGVGAEWDAKGNSEISIYPPLSTLWECDSQLTDSLSSNTEPELEPEPEPDATSELEHLCQDLSLEPREPCGKHKHLTEAFFASTEPDLKLPSKSSVQENPLESSQPSKDEKCIPVSRSESALSSSDHVTLPSSPHYCSCEFPEDSFQDVDLNT